jgi:hypothetical protein
VQPSSVGRRSPNIVYLGDEVTTTLLPTKTRSGYGQQVFTGRVSKLLPDGVRMTVTSDPTWSMILVGYHDVR